MTAQSWAPWCGRQGAPSGSEAGKAEVEVFPESLIRAVGGPASDETGRSPLVVVACCCGLLWTGRVEGGWSWWVIKKGRMRRDELAFLRRPTLTCVFAPLTAFQTALQVRRALWHMFDPVIVTFVIGSAPAFQACQL